MLTLLPHIFAITGITKDPSTTGWGNINSVYLLVGITLSSLYIRKSIKDERKTNKDELAKEIKTTIVNEVESKITSTVRTAIDQLDYKITQNGKNSNNIGDVTGRIEEKVDSVKEIVERLIPVVAGNSKDIAEHKGWHIGSGDDLGQP